MNQLLKRSVFPKICMWYQENRSENKFARPMISKLEKWSWLRDSVAVIHHLRFIVGFKCWIKIFFLLPYCNSPLWAKSSSMSRIHDRSQTHHTQWDSSGRVISPTQRPPPDNTQHSQHTNIHASGGIRTHNPSKEAAADPRLRPRGHWDRRIKSLVDTNKKWSWSLKCFYSASDKTKQECESKRKNKFPPQ